MQGLEHCDLIMNVIGGDETKSYMTTSQAQSPTTTVSTSTILTTIRQSVPVEPTITDAQEEYITDVHSSEANWKVIIPIPIIIIVVFIFVIGFMVALKKCRRSKRDGKSEIKLKANGQHTNAKKTLDLKCWSVNQSANDINADQHLPDSTNGSPYIPEDDDNNKSSFPLLSNDGAHVVNLESPGDDKET